MTNISKGTLLSNKKGDMFTISSVTPYTYKGVACYKVVYYPIEDSGLINKTKTYSCSLNELESKFTVLNWKFWALILGGIKPPSIFV